MVVGRVVVVVVVEVVVVVGKGGVRVGGAEWW